MDIEEIRGRKSRMEGIIQKTVSMLVNDFSLVTGIEIEEINIHMVDVTTMADVKTRYKLGSVEVELERI
jgi:uncharacterized alkaline shock family protein YloU